MLDLNPNRHLLDSVVTKALKCVAVMIFKSHVPWLKLPLLKTAVLGVVRKAS